MLGSSGWGRGGSFVCFGQVVWHSLGVFCLLLWEVLSRSEVGWDQHVLFFNVGFWSSIIPILLLVPWDKIRQDTKSHKAN